MVGGLLVALAALLAWWAATSASRPATTRYVAATRAINPGELITADQLTTVVAEIPASVRGGLFVDPDQVVGRVALGPIGADSLVTSEAIGPAEPPTEGRELTFPVSPGWALDGTLRPGEQIDVFATYGDGPTSQTLRVLAGVTVRRATEANGSGLGGVSGATLTVAVPASVEIESVVNATRAAEITIVRVTGDAAGHLDPAADRYRADRDLAADPESGSASDDGTDGGGR